MKALSKLNSLLQDQKAAIVSKFGSIDELYRLVFKLSNEDYNLYRQKPEGYEGQRAVIQNKLDSIESKLDELGIDGHAVITEISADHSEIIVNKRIEQLDNYLQKYGTDFQTMRDWLKHNYKI